MERMLRNLVKTCFDREASLSPECGSINRFPQLIPKMSFKQQFTALQLFLFPAITCVLKSHQLCLNTQVFPV